MASTTDDDRMAVDDAAAEVPDTLLEEEARLAALETKDAAAAVSAYVAILADVNNPPRAEAAHHRLAVLYARLGRVADLQDLVARVQAFLPVLSKAKGSKLFRAVLDAYLGVPGHTEAKVALLRGCVAWAVEQKRRFLRQALEVWGGWGCVMRVDEWFRVFSIH
jgi:hypothetical protein